MDAMTFIFWGCAALNVGLAGALAIHFRLRVKAQEISDTKAKTFYSWLCGFGVVFLGTAAFIGLVELFHGPLGHGEGLVASPLFNMLLAGVLVVCGKIVIGWEPVKWCTPLGVLICLW